MPVIQLRKTFRDKGFAGKYCLSPFISMQINTTGDVFLCGCSGWLPTPVGNIFIDSIETILSSKLATQIRQSIIDGSYIYCNERTCGVIQNNQLNQIDSIPCNVLPLLEDSTKYNVPHEISLAGDITCNLSCPSCRTQVSKPSAEFKEKQIALGNILQSNLFSTPTAQNIMLTLSTSGELFASTLLLQFLARIDINLFPNLTLNIQTNGLLCPTKWHQLGEFSTRIKRITVTIDAASKDIYEKLRRGGKWEDMLAAMEFLQLKKEELGFSLHSRMVAQYDNYKEILDFFNLSKSYNADVVEYMRISNWGSFTSHEFTQVDVFDPLHTEYSNAIEELAKIKEFDDIFLAGGLAFV